MTPIPKWRRQSFGCGLLFRKRRNCAWVGAGFGSAEEIPGRRAFRLGRRVAPTFDETSRLPGTLGLPSQPGSSPAQFAVVRLPPPTRTTVARRLYIRATADRPARVPHGSHAASLHLYAVCKFRSGDTSPRRWPRRRESPKADSFLRATALQRRAKRNARRLGSLLGEGASGADGPASTPNTTERQRAVKSVESVTERHASAISSAARSRSSSDTSSLGECM